MKTLITLIIALAMTGCGLSRKELVIKDPPFTGSEGAKGAVYIEAINDNRDFTKETSDNSLPSLDKDVATTSKQEISTIIGRQSNAYGIRLGNLTLPKGEDITKKMRSLVEKSFKQAGYEISNDPASPIKASVSVTDFWGWLTSGGAFNYGAKVGATVKTMLPDGKVTSVSAIGQGENVGFVLKEINFVEAFEPAVAEFVTNLSSQLEKLSYKKTNARAGDTISQIGELKKLLDSGALTQAEFDSEKQKLLSKQDR